ncbi:hypothetical protein M430DRAFT_24567 [Amorphotheca resinae ATCC 22711]|uniref:Uncharacterized protein n=1 Tax=Amorphotheca resinae ATCC 22711 TaxID=857342 RepID=A0A2T3BFQ0_AMORE|nr:hypothetical protein M430DRAFT_24567 [Amorphotheca resinae ATCC 22711]PSS28212.1 hypothetical protein M430DRAFT_24567 [Amorphotheca resinae ATCC 22711]
MYWLSHWQIPTSPSKCRNINQTVTCNFALYGNATNLSPDQKILPNNDITDKTVPYTIMRAFITNAIIALILSFALLMDTPKVHIHDRKRHNKESKIKKSTKKKQHRKKKRRKEGSSTTN